MHGVWESVSITALRTIRRAAVVVAGAALALNAASASAATTSSKVVDYPDASSVSSLRGYLAIAVGAAGEDHTLYVGHAGAIEPAKGVGKLPSWAQPHLGTAGGNVTTVIYPRCTSKALTSCDLYRYDVLTKVEHPLKAVNTKGGELEGAIDYGSLAFSRYNPKEPKSATGQRSTYVALRGSKGPRLLARHGGRDLAIWAHHVLQVRDTDPSYGICGYLTLETIVATTGAVSDVDHTGCGLDEQDITAPAFVDGGDIVWLFRSVPKDELLLRHADTGTLQVAKVSGLAVDYAPASATTGYLLTSDTHAYGDSRPPAEIVKLSKLDWTPAKGH